MRIIGLHPHAHWVLEACSELLGQPGGLGADIFPGVFARANPLHDPAARFFKNLHARAAQALAVQGQLHHAPPAVAIADEHARDQLPQRLPPFGQGLGRMGCLGLRLGWGRCECGLE